MKMKPVFIAFSTQKGGVGKTTFTVVFLPFGSHTGELAEWSFKRYRAIL